MLTKGGQVYILSDKSKPYNWVISKSIKLKFPTKKIQCILTIIKIQYATNVKVNLSEQNTVQHVVTEVH